MHPLISFLGGVGATGAVLFAIGYTGWNQSKVSGFAHEEHRLQMEEAHRLMRKAGVNEKDIAKLKKLQTKGAESGWER